MLVRTNLTIHLNQLDLETVQISQWILKTIKLPEHTHAHTHSRAYTRTHVHKTHTNTHTHTHTRTHTYILTRTHTHTHTHKLGSCYQHTEIVT
jgi:hypothetical protein